MDYKKAFVDMGRLYNDLLEERNELARTKAQEWNEQQEEIRGLKEKIEELYGEIGIRSSNLKNLRATNKTDKELKAENARLSKILRWVIEDSMCEGYSKERREEYYRQTIKAAEEAIKE